MKMDKVSPKALCLMIGAAVVALVGQFIAMQQMRLDIEEEVEEALNERLGESSEAEDEA